MLTMDCIAVYARMRFDQDTTDSTYQTMSAKIGSLGVKIGAASAFVEPEILSYSKEQLEAAEKENERTAYYGRKIEEMLRGQEHRKGRAFSCSRRHGRGTR